MVACLERGADLHMAQLMPLPLTVSCFSKIQIVFTFLILAHPGSPEQRAIKQVFVCFVCSVVLNAILCFTSFFCLHPSNRWRWRHFTIALSVRLCMHAYMYPCGGILDF